MSLKISNFKLGIGIPNSLLQVYSAFFESFVTMHKPDFELIAMHNGPINDLRNRIVEQALATGCSHLLMLDVDQSYPIDTVTKLLSRNLPVVHGLVYRRYPPFDNLLYQGEVGKYVTKTDYTDEDLVEVDATGTGCVLYDCRVFYKVKPPWYEFTLNPDKEKGGMVGEDIGMCVKLKKAGYKIMVDTSIKITHLALFGIDESFSTLYQSLLKRQIELDKRRSSNGDM